MPGILPEKKRDRCRLDADATRKKAEWAIFGGIPFGQADISIDATRKKAEWASSGKNEGKCGRPKQIKTRE